MRIPLSWLKEYIDIERSPEEIAKILTLAGLEVDAIEKVGPTCQGVVIAKVLESQKHPEADSLTIAKVTDGEQIFQIVCGAPNCRAGMKTALARVDAVLADETGKAFKIKKAKLRGVESFGMLCSAKELGVPGDADGIIEFAETFKEGTDVAALYADTVFEISLTPNLGHCNSVIGVVRELAAATGRPYRLPGIQIHEDFKHLAASAISVKVENSEGCPRYGCRVIRDVTICPSPDWLKQRLEASGIRPINNVVDATNYVMHELGNPLHAFDADKLDGHQIVVKNALKGEIFKTLDDKERILDDGDVVICDASKSVALAGIMGGGNSEVADTTKNIVIEAASFSPKAIRKTSKRLGLSSDASKRFERGSDPNVIPLALERVAMIIQQTGGGTIMNGFVDVAARDFPKKRICCRLDRINTVLGTQLSAGEVESILGRLDFVSSVDSDNVFTVDVPTYRNDLNEEIDLVEEVARVYGYNNITKSDFKYQSSLIPSNPMFLFEREMRARILREGLQEFLTCDLIGPSVLDIIKDHEMPESSWVRVVNPTSVEQSILRTSLLPGLLNVVKYNWDHQNQDVLGFEIGRIHFKDQEKYFEQSVLAVVMSGKSRPHHWDEKPKDVDFFDLKGIVENLLRELNVKNVSFKASSLAALHPGRQAAIYAGDLKIGTLGEVHPAVQRRLDVPQRIFFAEMNLHDLLQKRTPNEKVKPLPIFPGSERDWTLTLKEDVSADDVFKAIDGISSKYLENVSLVDIYRSDKLGNGLKNVTFRFYYRDTEKTMSQEKVDAEHARIVQGVSKAYNITS